MFNLIYLEQFLLIKFIIKKIKINQIIQIIEKKRENYEEGEINNGLEKHKNE